ncbi:MAG: hypothetical protein H8E27_12925 [Verrucomicrobia subdivision 3 bacterium]|nr:hypothetical protein [Limisphaerales bacterium]
MKQTQIITALALAGVTALSANAQDNPKPKRLQLQAAPFAAGGALIRPAVFPRGIGGIKLSEEQQKKMTVIRKAQSEAYRKIYQNKDLTPQDKRDQMADLRADFQKQIDGIYTKEQKAEIEKAKKAQAERNEQMKKLRIVLTEDQRAKLQKMNAKRQEAYKAVRELPQEERRDAYKKLSEQYQKDYNSILTDEQKANQKKMRELFGNRGGFGQGGIRILPAPGGRGGGVQPRIQPRQLKEVPREKK